MRAFLFLAILFPSIASAAPYSVTCTAPCVASDGTTQPAGTILNLVSWDGHSPYTATDGAGNTNDVSLVLNAQGTGQIYQPASTSAVAAQNEYDCTVTANGNCTMPPGIGLSQWTGSGTNVAYTVVLPPLPVVGPGSLLQVNLLGSFSSVLTIKVGSTTLATPTVTAPHVYRLEYTNSGWVVLPN